MKSIIKTDSAPAAIGPYSQAVSVGNLIFVSGQIPVNPETGEVVTGEDLIVAQAHRSFQNLKNVLESQNLTLDNVVKTTIFISDMNNFQKVNEVYAEYFKSNFPARSCVEVSRLPKDVLIETEAIAAK
jgi:2-iminobutanoate/2-iminopropanoate deaminase